MKRMRRFVRLKKFVSILAMLSVFASVGGHWFVLQGVAWAQMTLNFSHQSSFKFAVQKTFDGKHACKLCQNIQKGKSKEKDASVVEFKIGEPACLPVSLSIAVISEVSELRFNQNRILFHSQSGSPPTPPPRS